MASENGNGNTTVVVPPVHLSESDFQSLVIDYNQTAAAYPAEKTIIELFEAQVARTPDDEAVRIGDQAISYAQLNERANQLACHLRGLGAGPERLITLYMEHSIEVVCAILGVLKSGAAYVPVDPATVPKERLAFILHDISTEGTESARLPLLITQTHLLNNLPADVAEVVSLDSSFSQIDKHPVANPQPAASPGNLAYVIYTSGSTGKPKGVLIEHRNLVNYIWWANQQYCRGERLTWPLFSSLAFDLTVTSTFTPLISGGRIVVYHQDPELHSTAVLKVVEDGVADIVKLTPSHLAMIKDMDLAATRIRKLIVGGEDFKTELARDITRKFGRPVEIFNEYGPTEATVGCMIHQFDREKDRGMSVPIGIPAGNAGVYILDEHFNPAAKSVTGEMYLAGDGVARGYLNRPELTEQKFVTVEDPREFGKAAEAASKGRKIRLYRTGDLARWNSDGKMEFLGRTDQQVKIGGMRIELGEIEARLLTHPEIHECLVDVVHTSTAAAQKEVVYCSRCGVASTLPGTTYDAEGVCNLCRAFDSYKDKAQVYFKTVDEFKILVEEMKAARKGEYDCVVLFSGGKDSTFMLYKVCELGLKPLAFTLDNGFLSEEAMENVRRVVKALGVDHVFGTTPHMNEIFVDSLKQFSNVCNGCFKAIYTLATNLAHERGIGYIITGLSRGQFFETRLTEEVFRRKDFDVAKLDALVLEARKAYHQRQDAVSCHLAVDILQGDGIFDEIKFVDFYRYWSVPLEELYATLKERGVWNRPSDTGRSTNCLINDVGIYLHKKQRGFHNYSLPYSWDVRLGQKTRHEAMEELEDEIDEKRVQDIITQIGYIEPPARESSIDRLAAYYVSDKPLTVAEVRTYLAQALPDYMVPPYVVWLEKLPLTANGKVDRKALPTPTQEHMQAAQAFVRPQTETEQALAVIWSEVLKVDHIGANDDFFDLGGHSLLAIRAVSLIRDVFGVDIPLQMLFEHPTIAGLADVLVASKGSGTSERIARQQGDGPVPLSFAQEQLWYLDQLAPGSPVYNMGDVVELHGTYNAAAMQSALKELMNRHEVLRTTFPHSGGQPVQLISPNLDLPLPEVDLSALSAQERQSRWTALVQQQVRKPFDLSRGPLIRVSMVHLSAREHRLLLAVHHIIADEWSMEVVHQEVKALYGAFSNGQPSPLAELAIQYKDFACWQREWLQKEVSKDQTSYWKEVLAGARFILEMPTDKPRPATQSFRGAAETFQLSGATLERLKSLSREQQATLFMTLESAFAVLLHRYTGQDDIIVGTPISGRTRTETENLIGLFLNTVLMRAQFSDGQNFRSLLQQVRERALGAYAHPDLPFEHLVAEMAPERDPSRTPLFQVMFILHNSEGVSQVSKVSGNREMATGTSKFDLTLTLSESKDGLDGLFEYSTDLFEAATIKRFASYYARLLDAITADPDRSVASLPMLPAAESRQLQVEWNDTATTFPEGTLCLHQLIEAQVARTPDQTAVVFEQQTMTFAELNRRANQVAHCLSGKGIAPGSLIGLYVERSFDMVIGILGILKAGGAYVPLDPSFPNSRLSYMVEDSKMEALITHRQLECNLQTCPPVVVHLDTDADEIATLSGESKGLTPAQIRDRAYVLYTSGSTGKPKGVAIPHSAIVNFLLSMRKEPGFAANDILLAVTTLSFDIAGLELYLPLITGGRVVIASREDTKDPKRLMNLMQASGCTVMQATPATWRALIQAGWNGSKKLKVLCGGEALLRDLVEELLPRCSELWNMYGPTETTVWSAVHKVTAAANSTPIGKPIANTQLYILNARRELLPVGATGELYIGGDGLACGYLHREELTRERFVPNPFAAGSRLYRTGDLARWLPGGIVECLGRVDNQIKLRGFRIELGEIEGVLSLHPGLRQCAVIVREDVPGEKQLAAYFEPHAGQVPTTSDLRAHLEKDLPIYMVPSAFVAMEKLPLTPNGKIDRKALPKPEQSVLATTHFVAPEGPREQMLAQVWAKVLKVKRVGRHDNFFELGGHSLLAVRMVIEIEKLTNVRLPLAALLHAPTIAELADLLRRENWTPSWSSLVPIRPTGSRPPLFLMHAHGGNVLEYYALANLLAPDQPVYALQARGLDGHFAKNSKLQDMAAAYISEMRSLQPEGPYYLGGFCFGGLVALEVAQQLTAAGQEVRLLALIQTMHPEAMRFKPGIGKFRRVWYQAVKRLSLELDNMSHEKKGYLGERIRHVADVISARASIAADRVFGRESNDPSQLSMQYILERLGQIHQESLVGWAPRPYTGRVVLYRASKQVSGLMADRNLGWTGIFNGNLEVHEVPGHQQNLLLEPNVRRLAGELGQCLSQIEM
jgi:amino acid adenylation domain-containing protein